MRLPAIMRTTAARLSALYLLLFSLCAVGIIFYMTSLATGIFVSDTRQSIEQELASLDRSLTRGGIRALVRDIDRKARAPGAFVYLVTDQTGRAITGNVRDLQPGVMDKTGWTREPFHYLRFGDEVVLGDKDADVPRAVAHILEFDNGLRLLVGRDLGEPLRFRKVIRSTLIMALSVMAIGAILIWYFVGRRALRRIDAVSLAGDQIIAGDLSQRLPVTKANDEFDRLSASLNQMLDRIEKLNLGLREVSDSIAHDLKTPLTRLRNRAEDAIRNGADENQCRDALEDMIGEADQLIRIFNAMLMISRVEAGYVKFTPEPVDIAQIAEDMAELYGPLVEDEGGTMVNEVKGPLVVNGNRELVGQAITNMVDNAIKYGLKSGNRVQLSAKQQGDFVHFTVADNGEGIPAHLREKAMERFARLDDSRTTPGSGLGLALVSAIAGQHNGRFELGDAKPGLTATLILPVAKSA